MGCERLSPKAGLSELRGNQVRDEAEGLVTRFTEMVRSRQTDIDNAQELVEEAVRIIESNGIDCNGSSMEQMCPYGGLFEWFRDRSHNPKPLSWMTSPSVIHQSTKDTSLMAYHHLEMLRMRSNWNPR